MKRIKARRGNNVINLYLKVGILSAIIFVMIYGVNILNPTYTDWLLSGGDLSQHYLGWKAYRNGSWTFPIGLTDQLVYPNYSSVIFTDSIPVFAVLFKMFSPFLPTDFQYFGLWGIMCFVLQGCLAARIFNKFMDDNYVIITSSILVVFSPVMILRMYGQTALAGQWILLLLLDPLLAYSGEKGKKIYMEIALTAFLASAIHIYFALMCGIILLGICIRDWLENKRISRIAAMLLDYTGIFLATVWMLGGFSSSGSSFDTGGLGHHSLNWNALYNPQGWSAFFLDRVQYTSGQYEGFGYMGAGGLFLFAVAFLVFLSQNNMLEYVKKHFRLIFSVLFTIAVVWFVASSPLATWNDRKIYELILPEFITKMWSIFRASGRIVMIIPYILIISFVIFLQKEISKHFTEVLVAFCLILQLLDISSVLTSLHQNFSEVINYQSPLENYAVWNSVAEDKDISHVVVTYWLGENPFYILGDYTTSTNKTLNYFALAHPNLEQLSNDVENLLESPTEDEVFVFNSRNWKWQIYRNLNFYDAGDYIIGYSGVIEGVSPIDPSERSSMSADFTNNLYLENGFDTDGKRTIYPGGLSYGPYWYIPAGDYKIKICGVNIHESIDNLYISSNGGEIHYDFEIDWITDSQCEISLHLTEDASDLEVVIKNVSSEDIVLDGMTIERR